MNQQKFKGYQDVELKRTICKNIELLQPYDITLPEPTKIEEIVNFGLPIEEQFFKRIEQPKKLIELNQLEDINEARRRLKADDTLSEWVDNLWDLLEYGQWQYIRGVPTFITGDYLRYLSFNKIDTGLPQYRSSDMDKAQWWEFCIKQNPYCFGGIEMTRRRVGKSYIAGAWGLSASSNGYGKNFGIQSKEDKSAMDFFRKCVRNPLKSYPFYLKPHSSTDINTKGNRIEFDESDHIGKSPELSTWIEYGTSESKYFDGRKMYFYVNDECGKNTNADVGETLEIIRPCLIEDEVIIGKALFTSTVEEMERKGGANFKRIWDDSDRNTNLPEAERRIDSNGQTVSGLYPYFTPATHNYIFDQYGNAIINEPKDYQVEFRLNYLRKHGLKEAEAYKGGVELIEEMINKQPQGNKRQAMIRKFPRGIREAFRSSNKNCEFNEEILNKRLEYFCYGTNPFVSYFNLKWKDGKEDTEVIAEASTEQHGRFKIAWLPPHEYRNQSVMKFGEKTPLFEYLGSAGCDTFKYDKTKDVARQSMGTGYVYWGYDPKIDAPDSNPDEWKTGDFVCEYINRPPSVDEYCEDMLMMSVFYSVQMFPEFNIDHVKRHFARRGYAGYLKHGSKVKKKGGVTVIEDNIQAGAHTSEQIKPTMFKFMEKYVNTTAHRCKFPRLLEDLRDVEYHELNPYDSFVGATYAIMGYHEGLDKKPINEDKTDIRGLLRMY